MKEFTNDNGKYLVKKVKELIENSITYKDYKINLSEYTPIKSQRGIYYVITKETLPTDKIALSCSIITWDALNTCPSMFMESNKISIMFSSEPSFVSDSTVTARVAFIDKPTS